MKKCICFLVIYLFPVLGYANCWQIGNNDRRNFCLAISQNNDNYCWQISSNNQKNYCLALVKRDKNYCWQIDDFDTRQECLAFVDIRN